MTTLTFLDELHYHATNANAYRQGRDPSKSQTLPDCIKKENLNLHLVIPCDATVFKFIATLSKLLQKFFVDSSIDISNIATQTMITVSHHETIVELVIANCIERDRNRYPVSSRVFTEAKSD